MQYSLLSRFEGCLLGMTLGERLGCYVEAEQVEKQSLHSSRSPNSPQTPARFNIHRWHPNLQSRSTAQSPLWSKWVLHSIADLVRSGTWKLEPHSIPSDWLADSAEVAGGLAIASLPIALFFHDNLVTQRQQIEEPARAWSSSSEVSERVVTFGYAIAEALKEQIDPHTFIAQTLAYLRVTADPASNSDHWLTNLQQIRTHLSSVAGQPAAPHWQLTGANSDQIVQTDGNAIALALYCFLSTPQDFRLSILRAARFAYHPSIVCALTGALSGAYNSVAAVPAHWHLTPATQQATHWELDPHQIHQLSSRLLAAWSGIYNPSTSPPSSLAVATPWVIRPR